MKRTDYMTSSAFTEPSRYISGVSFEKEGRTRKKHGKLKKIIKDILIVLSIIMALFIAFVVKVFIDVIKEDDIYARTHFPLMSYFDESEERTYGYGGDGRSIDFESFYGITLETDGSYVTCTPYSHKTGITLERVTLNSITDKWEEREIKELPADGIGNPVTFDTSDLYNGQFDAMYTVSASFNDPDDEDINVVKGYLHIAHSIPKCCRVTDDKQEKTDERLSQWHAIIDKLDPKDCLDDSRLCYPTTYCDSIGQALSYMSYSCVKDYQELSDRIVESDWNDATKVYAFARYMTDNYAYDRYQVKRLLNIPRAVIARDVDNPAYWLYSSHVGMCQDFMNAMVIMCRHHGIPCTSLAGEDHVVPVAYINNEWVAIDVNPLIPKCKKRDTDPSKWVYPDYSRWDQNYGSIENHMDRIGADIDMIPYGTRGR